MSPYIPKGSFGAKLLNSYIWKERNALHSLKLDFGAAFELGRHSDLRPGV